MAINTHYSVNESYYVIETRNWQVLFPLLKISLHHLSACLNDSRVYVNSWRSLILNTGEPDHCCESSLPLSKRHNFGKVVNTIYFWKIRVTFKMRPLYLLVFWECVIYTDFVFLFTLYRFFLIGTRNGVKQGNYFLRLKTIENATNQPIKQNSKGKTVALHV